MLSSDGSSKKRKKKKKLTCRLHPRMWQSTDFLYSSFYYFRKIFGTTLHQTSVSLGTSSLLHNIPCIYVQFRLGHHVNLVTPFFLFCALLANDPYCFLKQNLKKKKKSNQPGIWEITADPINCPIKEIANKSNSASSRQNEKTFMKTGHKMSVKYGTMAPHKYWHKKLSIVIGMQP